MDRIIKKSLEDIVQVIDEVDSFFEPGQRRFDYYLSNTCVRRAIQMNISIIGEAVNRILKIDPELPITAARKIVSTRNYLIHGYDSLDHDVIWGIVIRHLPLLKEEVLTLLTE
ncbi:MAG: DUF86 domain-containing protein [Muribaculaceae bacterium]|nr:DUF86 domain-containing protein [Muribaculaceae bacterium]